MVYHEHLTYGYFQFCTTTSNSFKKYLLSAYYILRTVLVAADTAKNKSKIFALSGTYILVGGERQ